MSSGVGAQERVSVVGGWGGWRKGSRCLCPCVDRGLGAWMPASWLASVSYPFPAIDTIDELTFN